MNINSIIEAFERNNVHAEFVETVDEAKVCIKRLLPQGSTVSHGGSMTLVESGLSDFLHENYSFIERGKTESQTPD